MVARPTMFQGWLAISNSGEVRGGHVGGLEKGVLVVVLVDSQPCNTQQKLII